MSSEASAAPRTTKGFIYRLIMFCVDIAYALLFRCRIRGREHLPREGGVLVVANHESFLDIPLVSKACGRRHAAFVARASLADAGWLAFVMRECGAVLIERGSSDRAALRSMVEHLKAGDIVAVFPEGTRSEDGQITAFKKGAFIVARQAKVPVVPCGVEGTFEAWPRTAKVPRPRRIQAAFGPPIPWDTEDLAGAATAAVAELCGQTVHP